jgi:hypothetical protein
LEAVQRDGRALYYVKDVELKEKIRLEFKL